MYTNVKRKSLSLLLALAMAASLISALTPSASAADPTPSYVDSLPTETGAKRVVPVGTMNGSVEFSPRSPKDGDTVTLTATPHVGYELASLTVTDNNSETVPVTKQEDGTYTFTLYGVVAVRALFAEKAKVFADVAPDSYCYDAVNWAVKSGITKGASGSMFEPGTTCTRAQAITFLWRSAGSPEPTPFDSHFTDVDPDAYYYKAVLWATENRITKGASSTRFAPDAPVSRGQCMTFLYRLAGSPKVKDGAAFDDVSADSFCADAVAWAAGRAVTAGTTATTFSPYNPCTRGQIVTFLYCNYLAG